MVSTKISPELPLSLLPLSCICMSEKSLFFCFLWILVSSMECAHHLSSFLGFGKPSASTNLRIYTMMEVCPSQSVHEF